MKYIAIILLVLYPSFALADVCPRTPIAKGTPAPCTGYILSEGAMEEATKLPKQISLLEQKLTLKDDQIDYRDQKIKLLNDSGDKKDDIINKQHGIILEKDKNEALKIGLIVGGTALGTALLCIGIAFAISGSYKINITPTP